MADEKVSQLTEATSLGNNDLFYVVKDGVSEKIKYSNVEKNFTLKNVELGGLPTNWWDTSNPDGELYLYRYVEEDDGLVDPYFSITKNGIEMIDYLPLPGGGGVRTRIYHLYPTDLPKIHKLIDYDPDNYDFELSIPSDETGSVKLKIDDTNGDKRISVGIDGIWLTDLAGNVIGSVSTSALQKLVALTYEPDNDDYFNFDFKWHDAATWQDINLSYDVAFMNTDQTINKKASYFADKIEYYNANGLVASISASQLDNLSKIPAPPSTNGTYKLIATVSGGTPTYSWVSN